jgi:hypothetical protein
MLNIQIVQMQETGCHCANPKCQHDPKHMINILGSVWYIKVDTSVALITMGNAAEYYCRGCIDDVYNLFKMKLDTKMWAFH